MLFPNVQKSPIIVVVVICCLKKGGRFAAIVVIPNCCKIQESGRFAALVGICGSRAIVVPFKKAGSCCCCYLLPSKSGPLRGPSCGSQLFKRDQLFYLQKGGRFAPVVVVIFCLQKGGRFAAVVVVPNYTPIQKGGRFAKRPIILPSKRRPLLKPFKRELFILYLCSCPKKAAASRP